MYVIYGRYRGNTEEVDTAKDLAETENLVIEYRMAFGPEWEIWTRKE